MRKQRIVGIILSVFFVLVFSFLLYLRGHYLAPILMYHSVNPQASVSKMLVVSDSTFRRQMRFLRERNYNVIPLKELAGLIRDKKRIPRNTVCVTLDDGYKDTYTYAFPVLKEYKIPAAVFVILSEVGRPAGDRLSWSEIKQMRDSGLVTIGSHALGPEPLINIRSEEEIRRQIFDSKKELEENLGGEITLFSYPEGRFNGKIRQLVIDAGYKTAVATKAAGYPDDDIFALKRQRISSNSNNLFIFWVESSGYYTFFKKYRHK